MHHSFDNLQIKDVCTASRRCVMQYSLGCWQGESSCSKISFTSSIICTQRGHFGCANSVGINLCSGPLVFLMCASQSLGSYCISVSLVVEFIAAEISFLVDSILLYIHTYYTPNNYKPVVRYNQSYICNRFMPTF